MCCHGNSESFHKWRLRTKRTHQGSPRNRSTNSTSTAFGKSSLYLLLGICIGIAYSSHVSLALLYVYLNLSRKWNIWHYNTRKTSRLPGIWKICCWIHSRDWINRSCIVIHKSLVLDGPLHHLQCVTYAAILQIFILFSMIWYCRIQSPAVSRERDVRWCRFR